MIDRKERRLRIFTWGFILAFFFIAYKCSGQNIRIKRYSDNKTITILPKVPMKFNDGNNDTIYLSILADSLAKGYDCRLFCFMPHNRDIKKYSVSIWTADGDFTALNPSNVIEQYNYAEYDLSASQTTMINQKVEMIAFDTQTTTEPCVDIKTAYFFVKFFAGLK